MASKKVTLPGSARQPLGTREGRLSPDEVVDVSVVLKPMARAVAPHRGGAMIARDAFAARHGADPKVMSQIADLAKEYGLTVVEESQERRTVRLEGTVANMCRAFDVTLERYNHEGQIYRARTGSVHVPEELANSIEAVLGLDNRPQAKPHFRVREDNATGTNGSRTAAAASTSFTPVQVAQFYQFPAGLDGTGQTIGIIELGGGFHSADLSKYFSSIGVKPPRVIAVLVDKGKNKPTSANSADGEVLLDIEVAGSVAPGAQIVVYFAPNTTQGFQDALTTAIHDKTHQPSVISISWGGAESTWTAQSMIAFDSAAQDAAALGVSICAASGDNGSGDGVTDGQNHVDFPASSPNILACGGTSVQAANGAIQSESVWNDGASGGAGGGGFSVQFTQPAYQSNANIKTPSRGGRGVPDVAGDADPQTGYQVLVDGKSLVFGGTSAVAPLWSGLIALLNQKLGQPLGFLQPVLYSLPSSSGALNDITQGNNGAFSAAPGWDAATGLGSPNGTKLLLALSTSGAGLISSNMASTSTSHRSHGARPAKSKTASSS